MDFRQSVWQTLGKLPAKCDPRAEIISEEDAGTHRRFSIRYNVEENERVGAYVLAPKSAGSRRPAVVACHQHAGEYWLGKSEPAGLSRNEMYHYGRDLCLRGYVVLCPDHLCFEDRRPPEYRRRETGMEDGGMFERFEFTKRIAEGSTLQAKYISDLMRGVDVLQSFDGVDSSRIGAIGHSLGGQEALWLMWCDERIKAAVSSCGFSQLRTILRDSVNHNFAMYTFGLLGLCDIGDIVCSLAPRPFFMANGEQDGIFPVDGVREIAAKARERYAALNAPERFQSVVFPGGHSFPDEVKREAYAFLDRFLMNG